MRLDKRIIDLHRVFPYTTFWKDVAVWPKWTRFHRSHRGEWFYSLKLSALRSVLASKTAVTNTCHWSNQGNLDCLWIQLKRMLIKGPIPHRTRLYHILFGWHYASEEWWASQCCLFHALERYLYSLSFYMITFALFWAFDNPTSCSFHRILKTEIHHLC